MKMKILIAELLLENNMRAAEGFEDMKISNASGISRLVDKTGMVIMEKL